jgi:hypothetical protein
MTPSRPIGVHCREGGSHRESSLVPIGRLGLIYTPRRPIGVHRGEGGSHMESSLVPIGRLGLIYDSNHKAMPFFL